MKFENKSSGPSQAFGSILSVRLDSIGYGSIVSSFGSILSVSDRFYRYWIDSIWFWIDSIGFGSILSGFGSILSVLD